MSDDILNQAGFWLPPDFLSDDGDINPANTLFLNSVSATTIPFYYRSPEMETKVENGFLASSSSYFSGPHFAPRASKTPPMMSVSPQPPSPPTSSLGGNDSCNLIYAQPPSPPSPPTSSLGGNDSCNLIYALPLPLPFVPNHSLAGLCPVYNSQVLKHHSYPTWGIPITEVSRQKVMVHNREGERLIGFGSSMTMTETVGRCGWISAWPPLPQQRPNPLLRGGVLPGVFEMKRECAGTGVFLPRAPRRYGKHHTDYSQKKPDGMGRRKVVVVQQQLVDHHKKLQGEEDRALTHESRLPHEWTY